MDSELLFFIFLRFDICRFCVVIRIYHPRQNGQCILDFEGFLSQILSITLNFLTILVLEKEPVFPFLMSSAKQGHYWYYFITSLV